MYLRLLPLACHLPQQTGELPGIGPVCFFFSSCLVFVLVGLEGCFCVAGLVFVLCLTCNVILFTLFVTIRCFFFVQKVVCVYKIIHSSFLDLLYVIMKKIRLIFCVHVIRLYIFS